MLLKLQAPLVGQQPNIAAGGKATMDIVAGPRVGVLYAKCSITLAALGSGVFSLPLLASIVDPARECIIKMGGKEQIQRKISELAADNALQSEYAYGSVSYWQGGVKVATVYDIRNAAVPAAVAANTATTAVFQIPFYFFQPWRKDLAVGEGYAVPTLFTNGTTLPKLSVTVPVTPAAANYSGHNVFYWMSYDNLQGSPINNAPLPYFVKKGRTEMLYSTTGEITVPFDVVGQLMQFSLLLATGDTFSKIVIKKNGATLREVNKEDNDQTIYDHEMNVAAVVENRFDVIFDINDSPASALPLSASDTYEVKITLKTVAGAAQMVILTEVYGQPN